MAVTPSQLRADIYRLLDEVLETGVPLDIDRNGRRLRVVPDPPPSKLERLVPHPGAVIGDPESLVELDWSQHWNPDPS